MFIKHNQNPFKADIGDCVIRAISFALDIPYQEVFDDLCRINDEFYPHLKINSFAVFNRYLADKGFKWRSFETNMTVKRFCDTMDKGTVLMLVNGHMTVIKDGDIYDTWNPSRYKCKLCWVVK